MAGGSPSLDGAGASAPGVLERRPLSLDRIVDTALDILAKRGYDAVTMRAVARGLDTGAASLYAHVASKSHLDQLMIDRVVADIDIPSPDPNRWQEQISSALHSMRAVLQMHPGVSRAALGNVPLGPNSTRMVEGFLAILRSGGVPDEVAALATDLLPLYVSASTLEDGIREASHGDGRVDNQSWEDVGAYYAALPHDRYPNVVALASVLVHGEDDRRFAFGEDVLVAGLAAVAERERSTEE